MELDSNKIPQSSIVMSANYFLGFSVILPYPPCLVIHADTAVQFASV